MEATIELAEGYVLVFLDVGLVVDLLQAVLGLVAVLAAAGRAVLPEGHLGRVELVFGAPVALTPCVA